MGRLVTVYTLTTDKYFIYLKPAIESNSSCCMLAFDSVNPHAVSARRTRNTALNDEVCVIRLNDERFRLSVVVSESERNLPIRSVPLFGCFGLDFHEVLLPVVLVRSHANVNDTASVVLDDDSTHCPVAVRRQNRGSDS